MQKRLLASLMVLGLVTTVLGGFGVFAAFTDTATTGTNSITSGERARVADLQIAIDGVLNAASCAGATYVDDTTTPFFNLTDYVGGNRLTYFCLRNVGTGQLSVISRIQDLTQTDLGCTGDEAAVDLSCGNNGAGELGFALEIDYDRILDCDDGNLSSPTGPRLYPPLANSWGVISANEVVCGFIRIRFAEDATEDELQAAQSDQVTWRFDFEATSN